MRIPKAKHFENKGAVMYHTYSSPIKAPRTVTITNDKQRDKCIKRLERKCRSSMEYKDLIKYLRTNMDMESCVFLPKLGKGKRTTTEIHHEPYDLYTICGIVLKKHELEHDGNINEMMVAKEVMKLHYQGVIGLIPLSGIAHELVHDGKLFVPLYCVFGKFVEFTQKYYDAIVEYDETILDKLQQKVELTEEGEIDTSILNVCYVYGQMDGVENELPEVIPTDENVAVLPEENTLIDTPPTEIAA